MVPVLTLLVAACSGTDGPHYGQGSMVVSSPAAWRTSQGGPVTIGFRVANTGERVEVLQRVRLADGGLLVLHTGSEAGMKRLDSLVIGPGAIMQLGLGGHHIMTGDVPVLAAPGDTLWIALEFAGAGRLVVPTPLLRFSQARERLRR